MEGPADIADHRPIVLAEAEHIPVVMAQHSQLDWLEVAHKQPEPLVVSGLEETAHNWVGSPQVTARILAE